MIYAKYKLYHKLIIKRSKLLDVHHYLLVLKQLVELWTRLFQRVHLSQQRNHKFSQHILITNQQLQLQFMKVKDLLLRIIISSDHLIWLIYQKCLKDNLKLKSHLKLMTMVFYLFLLSRNQQIKRLKLKLITNQED